MIHFYAWIGALAWLLLAASVAIGVPIAIYQSRFDRGRRIGFDAGVEHARTCMMGDSWWFSEDEPTRQLIADLASGQDSTWDVRAKWRKARAARPAPEEQA